METNDETSDAFYSKRDEIDDNSEFWDAVNNGLKTDPLWTNGTDGAPAFAETFEYEERLTFLDEDIL